MLKKMLMSPVSLLWVILFVCLVIFTARVTGQMLFGDGDVHHFFPTWDSR